MRKSVLRRIAVVGVFVAAAVAPATAFADDFGIYYFNDGAGTCGYISCSAYGCTVIDTFPCPREVGGD